MRIRHKLIISLTISITLVAFIFAFFQVRSQKNALRSDLEKRAEILAESLVDNVEPLLGSHSWDQLQQLLDRFENREALDGVAVFDRNGNKIAIASALESQLNIAPSAVHQAIFRDRGVSQFLNLNGVPMEVYALPIHGNEGLEGVLALYHNASFIEAQSFRLWRDTFLRLLVETLLIAFICLLIIRISILEPVTKTAQWLRALRTGKGLRTTPLPAEELFQPIAHEATQLAKSLEVARTVAEEEAHLRELGEAVWTAERLRVHVRNRFRDKPIFAVSNREPYMHVHRNGRIECLVPASGLVTSLEPILRACDGTWVATGAGDADREVVDEKDRLRVPPDDPHYTLRRVWLTEEEERGYYLGFANEGLWPLCHIAHQRPTFREADWRQYKAVNQKFAKAVLEEMEGTQEPAVLIHDYHFALLPRMVKEKRPDARVAIFWHIPWPNPEAFGICPWQRELLDGLLGADIAGFHIQNHCNNFLETVDRTLECRIEWDRFAVNRRGHFTLVRPFPVSVVFDSDAAVDSTLTTLPDPVEIFKELGVDATMMGVGVDRMDYTKGIIERFHGIERFLEKWPEYQRKFTFVQIGAPSRTDIQRYRDLVTEIESEAHRINQRFQKGAWKPIILLKGHHSRQEIVRYYKAADICMVTSLHDGMNLVAKEFVAARADGQGVLILSRFTGACRELRDALIVNPYDTEQLAEAIRFGLTMDPEEKRLRMQRMRRVVREHNIYRWAARLVRELSEVRLDVSEPLKVR
ncbi:MAG TPA: trehalose-6-phosphate synthase [Terriglobia bacterium]|nr:trehalose-6-phosphate synthase [Terriglobia bacterium]